MENWGLITYRTTAILFDEANSDAKYMNRVAYVVAHGERRFQVIDDTVNILFQNLRISGLETWSPWIGGVSYGSMRGLRLGLAG